MTKTQKVIKGKLNSVENRLVNLKTTAIEHSFKSESHRGKTDFKVIQSRICGASQTSLTIYW